MDIYWSPAIEVEIQKKNKTGFFSLQRYLSLRAGGGGGNSALEQREQVNGNPKGCFGNEFFLALR